MKVRCQSRAAEAQTENENQPQLTTTAEIAKLRQVVQQQAELMQNKPKRLEREKRNLRTIKISYLRRLCKGSDSSG